MRAFALDGPDSGRALDWLHVHALVEGVLETADGVTVYLGGFGGTVPAPPFAAVTVREVAVDAGPAPTGLEHDRVVVVAEDLIVRPPWIGSPAGYRGIELVVPRGAAFGSGEHESTQAALLCLHALWNQPPSLGDVGTGSGILALYAATRGCPQIEACDIDAPSVAAAAELLPGARVHLGRADTMSPAACVVANMTATELGASLDLILGLWQGGGPLVLSGMRAAEVAAIGSRLPAVPAERVARPPFYALGLAAR